MVLWMFRNGRLAILSLLLSALFGALAVQAQDTDITYTFNQNKTSAGWKRAWGDVFREAAPWVEYSDDLQAGGYGGALKVNTAFKGGSWEEINVGGWLSGREWEKFDLTDIDTISYDLLLPTQMATGDAVIKLSTALDKEWVQIGPSFTDFPFSTLPRVTIGDKEYFKVTKSDPIGPEVNRTGSGMLILRLAAYHVQYQGPIYIDNVLLRLKRNEIIAKRPRNYDVVAGVVPLQLKTPSQGVTEGSGVAQFAIDNGDQLPMDCSGGTMCLASWDSTPLLDGFHSISFSYAYNREGSGGLDQRKIEVYVANMPIDMKILSPIEFQPVSANTLVKIRVSGPTPDTVTATIGRDAEVNLTAMGNGEYQTYLDLSTLAQGVHTLYVRASLSGRTIEKSIDIVTPARDNNLFIEKQGSEFVTIDRSLSGAPRVTPVKFMGFNAYDIPFKKPNKLATNQKGLVYDEFGRPLPVLIRKGTMFSYETMVDRLMMEARKRGLQVVRTWGFNSDLTQDEFTFYNKDWSYNETQFARFDYVLDSAARHGMRVVIVLQNYWSPYGGLPSIAKKFGFKSSLEFYESQEAQKMYRDYIEHFVNRTNTVSGIRYKDDPAIFSWELMNEPRMDLVDDSSTDKSIYDRDGAKLASWIKSSSAYIKELDGRHLVSTGAEGHGIEGFGGTTEGYGSDPFKVVNQPDIDFFTIHFYPNADGMDFSLDRTKKFLCEYVAAAHAHGKPLILEEWSINRQRPLKLDNEIILPKDPRYAAAKYQWMDEILTSFKNCGGNASLFWMLQMNQQDNEYGANVFTPADLVERDQPLLQILQRHATAVMRP